MIGLIGSETHSTLQPISIHYGSKEVNLSRLHPDMLKDSLQWVHKYIFREVLKPGESARLKIDILGDKANVEVIRTDSIEYKEIILPRRLWERVSKCESFVAQIKETSEYAERMDSVKTLVSVPESQVSLQKSQPKVEDMKASANQRISQAAPFVDMAGNAYSVVRQSMSSRYLDGTPAFRLSCAGFGSAAFWTVGSAYEVYCGYKGLKSSKAIRDEEGINRAYATLVSGGSGLAAAAVYVAGKGIEIGIDPMCELAVGLGMASNAFFCAGAIAMAGISSAGIYRCRSFRNALDRHIDHPNLPEHQKMAGAIRFLRESLIVTDSEIDKIRVEVKRENPNLQQNDLKAKQDQKIQDETQVKINALKRRTSLHSLRLILENSDKILECLESMDPAVQALGIQAAEELIQTVKSDSKKKERLHWITLAATVLFFVGYLAGCFLSSGILPLVCFAVASGILLVTTVYRIYKARKERDLQISMQARSALQNASS